MKELVVATRNRGKLLEIRAMLTGLVESVRCAGDFTEFPDTVEDGVTFEENALKKAREAARFCGLPAWPMIPAWWWMCLKGGPASIRPVLPAKEQRMPPIMPSCSEN